jgi:hypothetical protein
MTPDRTPIDGQTKANVTLVTPRQTAGFRSAVTARPEARLNGNSAAGRRTRDLFKAIMERLGNPVCVLMQADVLALAELKVAAEIARKRLLEDPDRGANNTVRLENMIRRSEVRVGLVPGGTAKEPETLEEYLARTDHLVTDDNDHASDGDDTL